MGSHNPRQLADLGWATDSQLSETGERRGTEGLGKEGGRQERDETGEDRKKVK